jgi:hypothetical protein
MPHPITIPNVHTDVNGRLLQADAKLVRLAEHISDFLKDGQAKRPNAWRDLVPYGMYEPFNGESQVTNIFRGTLGEQSGLSGWSKTEASRRAIDQVQTAVDKCTYNPKTYDWAIESLSYTGYRREWKSPVLCVRDFYTADKAKEQLAMILKAGSAVVDDTRVNFQREMYMYFAALAGRTVVMTSGFADFVDNAAVRFSFDPFVADSDGDEVIKFSASLLPNVSALNWDYIDFCKQWLTDSASDGAIGQDSGMPVFMAFLDKNEFEQMVYNDANLREDFRYAKPQALIDGFNMGFKTYRGVAIAHDPQQPRWELKKIGTGADAGKAILKRVNPRRHGRAGSIGLIPEANPDYLNAEFGTIIFYLKNVYTILVPKVLSSLGSGTSFGDGPAFNGDWKWINNRDMDTNVLGEIGYFFCRFEYHPKPEDNAANAIVLVYRRCVGTKVTRCDTDTMNTVEIDVATTVSTLTAVSLAGVAETNWELADTFTVEMPKPIEVSVGTAVTLTDASDEVITGYISSTVAAPLYGVIATAPNASFAQNTGAVTIKLT